MEPQIPNPFHNEISQQAPNRATATDMPTSSSQRNWGVGAAFGNWFASIVFSLVVPLVMIAIYGFYQVVINHQKIQQLVKMGESSTVLVITLIGTFIGQILSMVLSAAIVTEFWKKPFLPTLGWQWSDRFRFPHAAGLAILMLIMGAAFERFLPHHETSLEKFLKFGLPVKIALAIVATIGAPLIEEVVYRGVLFDALERAKGTQLALFTVTLLFWGVHVPQYIESVATLAAVLALSFVLTYLRASTKQLLPCVAVHTIFNGIQGILIILSPPLIEHTEPAVQPALKVGMDFFNLIGNW